MHQTFRIEAIPAGDSCALVLTGEIDLAVAPDLVELGTVSLGQPDFRSLVVDLGGVTFIDSTAIGALISLRNVAGGTGKQLLLRAIPDRVRRVFAVAGLGEVFETSD